MIRRSMANSDEGSRLPSSEDTESGSTAMPARGPAKGRREPWVGPRLECFGDVRQVTMGGTVGINESGNPSRFP